uniref:K Homology domain-containing protein n=1 Tax=Cricetulus griseus TaxID=10029 RepID=A0A8C2LSF7_CRIGR
MATSWTRLSTVSKIALGLGIPASAAIVHILYRRYRESREEGLTFVGEDDIEIEMGVCRAKAAIHQILRENTPMFEQLSVTQRSVDRIIGRGGKMIRSICKASGSKITCDKGSEGTLLLSRLVNISGTQKEVAAAKQLILEKVSEDEELGKRIAHSAETRVPRKQPISVRREEVMEPALWKNTGSSMGPAVPLDVPLHKGAGDMVSAGPKESSWERPNADSLENSGSQNIPWKMGTWTSMMGEVLLCMFILLIV